MDTSLMWTPWWLYWKGSTVHMYLFAFVFSGIECSQSTAGFCKISLACVILAFPGVNMICKAGFLLCIAHYVAGNFQVLFYRLIRTSV